MEEGPGHLNAESGALGWSLLRAISQDARPALLVFFVIGVSLVEHLGYK